MPIARAIGGTVRVAHRDRGQGREPPPDKILAAPDEHLVGWMRDHKHRPCVGVSRPPSPTATAPAGLPPIRSARAPHGHEIVAARGRRDRLQPATRSTLRSIASRRRAAASCSQWKLAVRLSVSDRAGSGPVRRSCHAAKCFTSITRVEIAGSAYAAGCGMSQAIGPSAGAHAGTGSARRCVQIHTRRSVTGVRAAVRSGSRVVSVRSPHEGSSSGQRSVDRLRGHLLTCAGCWPLAKRRLVRTSS